ncbi:MAG TPA: hypothetical protein PKZ77_02650, partial [Pseudomonadales bacterium]|nr:hypothetical protein [Pseudomonadales bacterium]
MNPQEPAVEVIPTQFAASLARMLSERGIDPARSMQAAGLDFDVADITATGYRSEIPALAYSRLYRYVMTALQEVTLGALFLSFL